jgi:hypothetical protein
MRHTRGYANAAYRTLRVSVVRVNGLKYYVWSSGYEEYSELWDVVRLQMLGAGSR